MIDFSNARSFPRFWSCTPFVFYLALEWCIRSNLKSSSVDLYDCILVAVQFCCFAIARILLNLLCISYINNLLLLISFSSDQHNYCGLRAYLLACMCASVFLCVCVCVCVHVCISLTLYLSVYLRLSPFRSLSLPPNWEADGYLSG
jgi:hypothetical protein